jgi:hypothetical protein
MKNQCFGAEFKRWTAQAGRWIFATTFEEFEAYRLRQSGIILP